MGAASVIWAYDGWIAVSMIAGEVRAPERLMRRIIVAGMLAIVFLAYAVWRRLASSPAAAAEEPRPAAWPPPA
jgi:type VI protein secretion system component VasK